MRVILAGILGGIALFIWGYISWMVLPWHNTSLHRWANEQVVSDAINANSPMSGVYISPMKYDTNATSSNAEAPMIFVSITRNGMQSPMWVPALVTLFAEIVAACIVAWMLFRTSNLGFFSCVSFVTVFGIAAGIVSHIPYMTWFGFGYYFTAVQIADLVIGWYFAGVLMALVYLSHKKSRLP